jgi:SAM-dependent methyltransferase
MNLLRSLQGYLRRQNFQPTAWGVICSPVFIIRRGLFLAIRDLAASISGDVLDFGCGSKPYEFLFTKATSYTGVDIPASGHNHNDSRIDVFYEGRSLPFSDSQFDAVVSFEVFEHVFNLSEILEEINRVTRNEGLLLISIPFAWNEHEEPFDFARYTTFGISHLLKKAGYDVLEIRKTTTFLLAVFQMLIAYLIEIAPRNRAIRALRQVFVLFPLTLAAYVLNAVLPQKSEYFSNSVILARKVSHARAQTEH